MRGRGRDDANEDLARFADERHFPAAAVFCAMREEPIGPARAATVSGTQPVAECGWVDGDARGRRRR